MILCHLQQSSGCLGCFIRPPVNTSASNLSKELGVPGRSAGKRSISEDFWTTSTCDMDNSAVQSQGSISSLGTNNLIPDTNGGSGSASAPSEFVNHGKFLFLLRYIWNWLYIHVNIFEQAVYFRRLVYTTIYWSVRASYWKPIKTKPSLQYLIQRLGLQVFFSGIRPGSVG